MTDVILSIRDAVKRYGETHALDRVDLDVAEGEFLTLLGPSGSGKTTLLTAVAGFTQLTAGSVSMRGTDITALPPEKRGFGMVFQGYALFPTMTVAQNVGFPLKVRGRSKAEIAARVAECLDLVQMGRFADRMPQQLSGGQQQRVALARALITKPKVLLLDGPLSALDPFLRIQMRTELKKLQRELGIIFIHVTHGQDEALALADEVVVMNNAVIEQAGTPRDVFNAPRTEFVARFMGGHNVISLNGGKVALRADDVRLGETGLPATVTTVEYQGATVSLLAKTEAGEEVFAILPEESFFKAPKSPGEAVTLAWDEGRLHRLQA